MPNPYFQFKQFVVFHDKCAMKVGTDGVLVGAWAQVDGARRVLDIGTGSGLIALMLAQRNPDAFVTAVDIDEAAVEQARENVARTPWSDRMEVERLDIRKAPEEWNGCFDAIVSNPPYLLSEKGSFSVVLPATASADFLALALGKGLHLSRQTWVHPRQELPAKRVLMAFVKYPCAQTEITHLPIETERHVYTPEFSELARDFYLAL